MNFVTDNIGKCESKSSRKKQRRRKEETGNTATENDDIEERGTVARGCVVHASHHHHHATTSSSSRRQCWQRKSHKHRRTLSLLSENITVWRREPTRLHLRIRYHSLNFFLRYTSKKTPSALCMFTSRRAKQTASLSSRGNVLSVPVCAGASGLGSDTRIRQTG